MYDIMLIPYTYVDLPSWELYAILHTVFKIEKLFVYIETTFEGKTLEYQVCLWLCCSVELKACLSVSMHLSYIV